MVTNSGGSGMKFFKIILFQQGTTALHLGTFTVPISVWHGGDTDLYAMPTPSGFPLWIHHPRKTKSVRFLQRAAMFALQALY